MSCYTKRRLIVGISGASGIAYGVAALGILRDLGLETHLVMTRSAMVTAAHELSIKVRDIQEMASVVHRNDDIAASISSGSFQTMGMLVAPCSIRSVSEIGYGMTSSLLTRAADVVLKERRRLVLMVRETPLHLSHLRAMTQATEAGAVIMPPLPALYIKPASIHEMIRHSVGRALDLFGIDSGIVNRWGENTLFGGGSAAQDSAGCAMTPADSLPAEPDVSADRLQTDNEFWRFSLSFYSRSSVASACLVLQNRLGVDINVLLMSIFAAVKRRRMLSAEDLRAVDDVVAPWRVDIVESLRRIRTRLKSGPPPAPSGSTENLRTHVKVAERNAEQIEHALLLDWLDRHLHVPPASSVDAGELLLRIIRHFATRAGDEIAAPDITQSIQALTEIIDHVAGGANYCG
jgi:4-hydroxy-3-polyprenylbenzoate decarboxylase